jgi:hypothetical protein
MEDIEGGASLAFSASRQARAAQSRQRVCVEVKRGERERGETDRRCGWWGSSTWFVRS